MKISLFLATLLTVVCLATVSLRGQTAPSIMLQTNFVTGLSSPVHLTNAGDGSKRLFMVQQQGIIKVLQNGSTTPTDFLNISSVVSSSGGERGLLGLAFHPQYETNGRFFVYYTRQSDGAIEIAEYSVSSNPNVANPNAVRVIITIPHPTFANHNGGTILFGPDGFLYAGTGDGGSGNDPQNNAQNINSLLGKMLRLDINTPVGQTPAYNIPPTNPFAGATPGADEVYALGLRNPYRFSFDRGGTQTLWVADVGQDAIEEVDNVSLGGNYGWRVFEGTRCTNNDPGLCNPANYTPPVFQYSSAAPDPRCSVTGGYVYRGTRNALPVGSYIYGDFCTGEIFLWNGSQQLLLTNTGKNISSFGEDEDGELYVVYLGGTVDKVLGTGARKRASSDFDGNLATDLALFRPSNGTWYIRGGLSGLMSQQQFGQDGDIPAAEDFDGDKVTDLAVFRPSNATWYYITSSNPTFKAIQFGNNGDIPVAADYDGDGKGDLAVFRPSNGTWTIQRSSDGGVTSYPWGANGDVPVPGDYDGDERDDFAVWRPSNGNWYVTFIATGGISVLTYGEPNDIPAPGDYDGDGKNDRVVFRPSTGQWFMRLSTDSFQILSWGTNGDIPVAGDYDGDRRTDLAVFRPSNGVWYVVGSTLGLIVYSPWGTAGDLPIPKYDYP
jgi:glucose/arabinose dehydrogenase